MTNHRNETYDIVLLVLLLCNRVVLSTWGLDGT